MTAGPTTRRIGDEIYVVWPDRFTFGFSHFLQAPWGLQAEVSVVAEAATGEIGWGQVQLTSADSRGKLSKRLGEDAAALFDRACREALACWRRPPDWVTLQPRTLGAVPWVWTDWVPANQTTVLYGDGDSGKSLLALTVAVCALSGLPLAGTWPIARSSSVLYVDYESTADDHQHRLALLTRALEVPEITGLHYLPASRPLSELGPELRAQRDRTKATLLILDSLGAASGGEPESAQAALAVINTLRQMGPTCTNLVLAHVSKAAMVEKGAQRKAYGSVYVRNGPRANVEMRRLDAVPGLQVTLRVDKNNLLHHKPPPIGLALELTDDGMAWRRTEAPMTNVSAKARILAVLPTAPDDARSSATVAKRLNLDSRSVARALERMADLGLVRRVALGGKGQGDFTTWIRLDNKCDSDNGSSATPWEDDPQVP